MAIYQSSPQWMERGQGRFQAHPAPKSLVFNRLLIFIVTNNGETNGDKHWKASQQQMALKAGQPVQTALTVEPNYCYCIRCHRDAGQSVH